jgi:hypothetical protein
MPTGENRLNSALPMSHLWTRALLILAAVWLVAGGAMWWARHSKPTPESLLRYVESHPIAGRSAEERRKQIEKITDQLNCLDYQQRREMRVGRRLDGFFKSLTPDEQGLFLDRTLPAGFKQMMEALNKMDPAKRKQFVDKALEQMKRDEGKPDGENAEKLDANAGKIIDQGLKSFYSEASAETKMDLGPLIEQMQKNLQGAR